MIAARPAVAGNMAGAGTSAARKKAAVKERARARHQEKVIIKRGRKLRPRCNEGVVLETVLRDGALSAHREEAPWGPEAGSVISTLDCCDAGRTIFGVAAHETRPMLAHLMPLLLDAAGLRIAARGVLDGERRGASVILTRRPSSSHPHMDSEDTLLANISGTRKVWVANFEAVSAAVHRKRDDGGTTFLVDLNCDPSWHELKVCADNGVKWTGPVVLESGDAIFIPRGFWHCLLSEAGGVAVPIEIVSSEGGDQPHVWRHAGVRTDRARAHMWGSAASVLELWAPALEVFEFQKANATAIKQWVKGKCKGRKCSRFHAKGIPCKKSSACSFWPCLGWEESELASTTTYRDMPLHVRAGGSRRSKDPAGCGRR